MPLSDICAANCIDALTTDHDHVKLFRWNKPTKQRGLIDVRAHAWMHHLRNGAYRSIEQLAEANRLHPKVVRQALRIAFLSPDVTSAILDDRRPTGLSLARIPKLLLLSWTEHRRLVD